eukprot:TRINITY_DN7946_c0_g1_i1.p1 TRINITY_DN7946_c0_g1~~TRINITY_DN7946_c0_g1_i1.p1  ORF type:complete len:855 (+),score=144.84 TRINITY_DN7946_c0_g1_i1:147-2711(+)
MSVINLYQGSSPTGYYRRLAKHYCQPPPKLEGAEEPLSVEAILQGYQSWESSELKEQIPYLDPTEGSICYAVGGDELTTRVTRGIAGSALIRDGVPREQVIASKRSTCNKILTFLREQVHRTPETVSFLYFCLQGLGYAYRVNLLIIITGEGCYVLENGTLLPFDPPRLCKCVGDVLCENADFGVRKSSFESLFGISPPDVFFKTVPCACLQLQEGITVKTVARRWYTLLTWAGRPQRYLQTSLTTLMHVKRQPEKSLQDDNILSVYDKQEAPAFSIQSYERMRDDLDRTLGYQRAIHAVCEDKVCLEIGTGPFALLSIMAVKAGAKHVYAIEANREAVNSAHEHIKKELSTEAQTRITVIEGLSTAVSLPEGVAAEVVIHELIGVIATEEGVIETMNDAYKRLLSKDCISIPFQVRTKTAIFADPRQATTRNNKYSLGIGLDLNKAVTDIGTLECVTFTKDQLPGKTEDVETKVSLDILSNQTITSTTALQMGIWVELQLLSTDSQSDVVSSIKDCSSWPKCLCLLKNKSLHSSTTAVPYSSVDVQYSISKRTAFAYSFEVADREQFVLCHELSKMDAWLRDFEAKSDKKTTSVSEGLSPLHKAIVLNDTRGVAECGYEPRFWKVLDPVFGLSALQLHTLLNPTGSSKAVSDVLSTFSADEVKGLMSHRDSRFDVGCEDIAQLVKMNIRSKPVTTTANEEMSVSKIKESTGRTLINSTLHGYDFIVDVWLKIKPSGDTQVSPPSEDIINVNSVDSSIHASRRLSAGDPVGWLHGVTRHVSEATENSFPFPGFPFVLDMSEYCSLAALIKTCKSEDGNCTVTATPHFGTISLLVEAIRPIEKGELLSLVDVETQ